MTDKEDITETVLPKVLWNIIFPHCRHSYQPKDAPRLCMIGGSLMVCEWARCPIVGDIMRYPMYREKNFSEVLDEIPHYTISREGWNNARARGHIE